MCKYFIALSLLLLQSICFAFEPFIIENIRLKGLERISAGTVFNSLSPITTNKLFSLKDTPLTISNLYKTGFFKNIRLEKLGNVLIIKVQERPTISKITFEGNTDIETEDLTMALKNINFAKARVFNHSILEKVKLELQRQYFSLGKYATKIETIVTPLKRNQVAININIHEGNIARIQQINFVGNRTVADKKLLNQMILNTGGWFSFITQSDKYSDIQLSADLKAIESYYLDRGYMRFKIESTQVTITPDKQSVYITINMTEGDIFTIKKVKLSGNFIVDKSELENKLLIKAGDIFSRKKIIKSKEAISNRISNEGYYYPEINPVPIIDEKEKTIVLNFIVDPGKRIYVRRINYKGNYKTKDEVLRREMRQMEGGWITTQAVKRSVIRLERLRYFESVKLDVERVLNTDDMVDINYTVIESPSGNLMAGMGYSQTYGVLFNASIIQDNFLGSGKQVGITFENSEVRTTYRFSYLNPYTNIDGVSRRFSVFYRTTDAEEAHLSRYTTDVYGTTINYGLPVSEYDQINAGFAFDHTKLNTTDFTAQEVFDFINLNGNNYNSYRLIASFQYDTRNRTLFPDSGTLRYISAEVALPVSDLDFYKIQYKHQWLYPIVNDYILLLKANVSYGDGYGNTENLPFFENYVAGGPRTIRGFRGNTLGPLDSTGLPFGGNLRLVSNVELILPLPFTEKSRSFRLSTFLDMGNVYGFDEDFNSDELRYSTGVSAIWASPIGILSFSYARPLNKKPGDQLEFFQFTIGTTFNW
ncbi:MAG: outer membrane protein assembly factor BamA [Thiomargarita sp.]|nr:outer membrane protein assembly factor BamA [Thiomargarita sp.]